jgi:hypothetical protein
MRSKKIKSVKEHEFLIPNFDTEHQYHIHNARRPVSKALKKTQYDSIVITSTFLDLITDQVKGEAKRSEFEFLSSSSAVKIAFPQDDYWMSEVRDNFYTEMKLDYVFSVCQPEYWPILFPRYHKTGTILRGFTAYIHKRHFELFSRRKKLTDREFDVVYRGAKNPLFPNALGYLKANLGLNFQSCAEKINLKLRTDLVGNPKPGNLWEEFIGNSMCVLGSPSGSSTLIRNKGDASKIEYIQRDFSSSYAEKQKELERAFPDELLNRNYSALSPRNFEAAACGTAQILFGSDYDNILTPWEDYLPFSFDEESLLKVNDYLQNPEKLEKLASNCWRKLSQYQPLRVEVHVEYVFDLISKHRGATNLLENSRRDSRWNFLKAKVFSFMTDTELMFRETVIQAAQRILDKVRIG